MTSSMPWIKLYTDILDDPKIGRLDAVEKWRFVALCVMAGECDAEGYLVNGDKILAIDEIAWRLREDVEGLRDSMDILATVGVIDIDEDGAWFVTNFAQRQGRSQSEKRKAWRERKRRQREQEPDEAGSHDEQPEDVTRDTTGSHAGVTALEKRREEGEERREESEKEKDIAGKPATTRSRASPGGLSEGQREWLGAFGAKRFANNVQRDAVLALEQAHGTDVLLEGITWAAKQGMSMGKAITALETALPKWGKAAEKNGVIRVGR